MGLSPCHCVTPPLFERDEGCLNEKMQMKMGKENRALQWERRDRREAGMKCFLLHAEAAAAAFVFLPACACR